MGHASTIKRKHAPGRKDAYASSPKEEIVLKPELDFDLYQ
jgi:hypothetical protein